MRRKLLPWFVLAGCSTASPSDDALESKMNALSATSFSASTLASPAPWLSSTASPQLLKAGTGGGADCGATTFVWEGPSSLSACPAVAPLSTGQFVSEPVFANANLPELRRYCAFVWHPASASAPPDVAGLSVALSQWGGAGPEPDCPVVGPQTPPIDAFADAFETQLVKQDAAVNADLSVRSRVRVAVIDSAVAPYDTFDPARYDKYGHGRLMGRIIHRLACPADDASCAVAIHNELALPHFTSKLRDPWHGGYFGTRLDLARAIHRALTAWGTSENPYGAKAAPLALNLSVAWDPIHGGAEASPSTWPVAARLVYVALERASCLGAATIAAMGNRAGDSRTHPMLPAAWSNRAAPDAARCTALTGLASDAPGLLRPRSPGRLLEASAGVDLYDLPLTNARAQATPRLVAYGQSAVLRDRRTSRTDVLSGSSVSTAVLSAAVAAVWSVAPSYSASNVLDLIYDQGVQLRRTVEPCATPSCDQVKRVSVCNAARRAQCLTGDCSRAAPCMTVGAFAGTATVARSWFDPADYPPSATTSCTGPSCDAGGPSYSEAPWVGPQPGPLPCPYCFVSLFWGQAILILSPPLQSASSLEVALDNGTTYGMSSARFPETLSIFLLDTRGVRAANLRAVVGDGGEARVSETPLFVF